ncbi:MAG TPA: heat-inducible transcriptional repressor HrcA [Solirubrobacteraceae bacterium]|nr:heat-inducible transcriptional repressor HrcA [Solirubrobacteraceae bacterium]
MLTPRQELILRKVLEGYVEDGQPVGSKLLASDQALKVAPSTIRHELAMLEEHGLLGHPHTSAGRVPTEAGYRYFVDRLLPGAPAKGKGLGLSLMRREVDEAMRTTTAKLSQVTDLLALVSAPPIDTATIRHIEVLTLQPQVLMVVIITSTGGVTKRVFTFDAPVDSGIADWASAYLNEQLVGMGLGARMLHSRLAEPSLSASERAFLDELAPAFFELAETADQTLYVDGSARLLREHRFGDLSQLNELMGMLERRVTLLAVLRAALNADPHGHDEVQVRIGHENDMPALRSVALIAAPYGLPRRTLGAVSVIGPVRMDYATAIHSVRSAAAALSLFVQDVYDVS